MGYRITNKWIVTFGGALMVQLAIGALYAWSLFNQPISKAYGWDLSNVITTYSICLASFSLSTILSGRVQLKKRTAFYSFNRWTSLQWWYFTFFCSDINNNALPYIWCNGRCRCWIRLCMSTINIG